MKGLKVAPSNASFIIILVSCVILERQNKEITAALGEFEWEKGYYRDLRYISVDCLDRGAGRKTIPALQFLWTLLALHARNLPLL